MADEELDFDELHQAVNQIMTNKKPQRPSMAADPYTPALKPAEPTTPKADPPALSNDGPVNVQVRRSVPPISVPPRRRGNVMDIVSTTTPVAPPSSRPSRTAPPLQPTKPVEPEAQAPLVTPHQMAPKPAEPTDEILASLNMKDESDMPSGAPASQKPDVDSWPDPLDYHGFKDGDAKNDQPKQQEKSLAPPHEALIEAHEPHQEEPPAEEPAPTMTDERPEGSPFIDAKVEKRPLGAYNKEEPKDFAREPQNAAPALQPKELSPEVVAVESAEPEVPDASDNMNSVRQMAIPQQYHTRDRQPNHDERPVFDTKDYHPPIDASGVKVAAPKHKTTAMIIILLVLLVAAAGVGFLWMTGMLDLSRFI